METYIDKIPFSEIVKYLLSGIFILLIMKFISSYILPLIRGRYKSVSVKWKQTQIVIWLLFTGMFYTAMVHNNLELTVIVTSVVLLVGWRYWRNVFSGILIIFYNKFTIGDTIATDFVEGKFSSIKLAQSELVNIKGEYVIVPNFKLINSVLKHHFEDNNARSYSFIIEVDEAVSKAYIYKRVISCPYISANQEIIVEKESPVKYSVKVSILDTCLKDKTSDFFKALN